MVRKNRKIFYSLILLFVILLFCYFVKLSPVQAQTLGNEYLTNFGEVAGYGEAGLPEIIGRIVKIALSLLGLIAVIIMITGGFVWMTSGGVPEKVTKAKKIISSGLIGLLIIVFAYAIVAFVMSKLSGVTGPGSGGPGGCTPSLCCGPGLRCDSEGSCNISDPSCTFPADSFRIKKIETTHDGLEQNYNQDVYLCSAVQPIFNHSVDGQTIEDLEAAGELRIETTEASPVSGNWQTRDGAIIFKHPDIFTENTSYEAFFPKAILDTQGKILQQCLAAGGCVTMGDYFIWNFTTGTTVDDIPPEITSTYPIFDLTDPIYPDQNVSRKPNIEVSFSEAIDMTTVSDESNYPINTNIWLTQLDGSGGAEVEILANDIFEVDAKSKGFRIRLRDPNLLEPFTWYRVHVEGIQDLCLNAMDGVVEWEFQTNDQAPGINSQYPTGAQVCPDTDITVVFNTQMYDNLVRFEITGADTFTFEMRASELSAPYEKEVVGGVFKITDPGDPVNNHFRVFTFNPNENLQSDSNYQITVLTDLVIDQQGTLLSHTWNFTTATPENCLCSPWISYLQPAQGSKGECITLHGQCFKGTSAQPAEPIKLDFILDTTPIEAAINGADDNYLTTQVPSIYLQGDRPEVQATIEYDSGDQLDSNLVEFYVDSNEQANGPCLFFVNPSAGYSGETEVDLSGIRFGTESASSQVVFYNNKTAVVNGTWTDTKIDNALVPLGAEDGLVYLVNDQGASNGLPFDVLLLPGGPGQTCQQMANCPDNLYSCSTPVYECLYQAADDCRCCCNPIINSCNAPLECMADQGNCTGDDRGLCCGCASDSQCGDLFQLGCGMLDPNRCCYSRPQIILRSPVGNNICLNTAVEVKFNQAMDRGSLNKNNIKLIKVLTAEDIDFDLIINNNNDGFIIYPTNCLLEPYTSYKVDLIGGIDGEGIRSEMGVSTKDNNYWCWQFITGAADNFCQVDYVSVNPNTATVESLSQTVNYVAIGYDNNDTPTTDDDIPVCVHSFSWASAYVSIAAVSPIQGLETTVSPVGGEGTQTTNISATISEYSGSGEFISVLSPPVITGIKPNQGTNNPVIPTYITITGSGFGDKQNDSYVQFDDFEAEIGCQNWSDLEIVAIVPPNLELTLEEDDPYSVTVVRSDQGQSNAVDFKVTNEFHPAICQLLPNQGQTGTQITIQGVSFGDEMAETSKIDFGDVLQSGIELDRDSNKILSWSNENIKIKAPEVPEAAPQITVYVPSPIEAENLLLKPSNAVSFYKSPKITSISPKQGPKRTWITIKGENFGSTKGNVYFKYDDADYLSAGTFPDQCLNTWKEKEIVVVVPNSLPDVPVEDNSYQIQVYIETANDIQSNLAEWEVNKEIIAPGICSITPNKDLQVNDLVDIVGDRFALGLNELDNRRLIFSQDKVATSLDWISNTKINNAILPLGTISGDVVVQKTIATNCREVCHGFFFAGICVGTLGPDEECDEVIVNSNPKSIILLPPGDPETFVLPQVVEDSACSNNTQSPSPRYKSSQACRNAVISARFNMDIDSDSLVDPTDASIHPNIVVQKCNSGEVDLNADPPLDGSFDSELCVTDVSGTILPTDKSFVNPEHNAIHLYPDITTANRFCFEQGYTGFKASYSPVDSVGDYMRYVDGQWVEENSVERIDTILCSKGFIYTPDASLTQNYWYQVTLKSGDTGIISSVDNYQLDGNKDGIEDGSSDDDYIWYFKTKDESEVCSAQEIKIFEEQDPEDPVGIIVKPGTKNYYALPIGPDCQILNPNTFTWEWESTKPDVATVVVHPIFTYTAVATAVDLGETEIKVIATPTPLNGGESATNSVDLVVATHPIVESFQPSGSNVCRNSVIKATFYQLMNGSSISSETISIEGKYSADQTSLDCTFVPQEQACNNLYKSFFAQVFLKLKNLFIKKISAAADDDGVGHYLCKIPISISVSDKDFPETNDIIDPQNEIHFLYSNNATARQYCFDQGYDGFDIYTTTTVSGNYMRYNNGAWGIVTGHGSYIATLTCYNENIKTIVNINAGLLEPVKQYKVTILGGENGVESIYGINMAADYNPTFTTSDEICTLSRVEIEPKTVDFTVTGDDEVLDAFTYDKYGNEIFGIPNVYDWTWLWESSDISVVSVAGSILKSETVTALDRNGKVQITATAKPTYGDSVSGHSKIDVFICEVPWPVYQDLETNFELRYCIDKIADEGPERLPELLDTSIAGSDVLIKEFLFSVVGTGDVIGLKVFNNLERLSILNWYKQNAPNPGNPSNFVIDNYYALREGRTTYVAATNVAETTFNNPQHNGYRLYPDDPTANQFCIEKGFSGSDSFSFTGNIGDVMKYAAGWSIVDFYRKILSITCDSSLENGIYNHIYLISYNDNAKPETIEIFNQLLANWQFNINLDNPFEDKPKLQRDLLRLYDIDEIKDKLNDYYEDNGKYPTLGAGTFVSGKTNSKWSSWQNTLGQALNWALPIDPVNDFCTIHSDYCYPDNEDYDVSCAGCPNVPSQSDYQCQGTCYNSITREFGIPNGSHVYQYYVPEDPDCAGQYYNIAANFEYSDEPVTWRGIEDFVISQADDQTYANYVWSYEVAAVCGDGELQCGEVCDGDLGDIPLNTTCNSSCDGWTSCECSLGACCDDCHYKPDGTNDCGSGCQRCVSGSCQDYNSACTESDWNGCLDSCTKTKFNGICSSDSCGTSSANCGSGEHCSSGICSAGQCSTTDYCYMDGYYTGKTCSGSCSQPYGSYTQCLDAKCESDGDGTYSSFNDSTCSSGSCSQYYPTSCGAYICSGNVCKTSCSSNSDCVSGYHCDGSTCYVNANSPDCSVCNENSDCTGGYCRTAFGTTTKRCTDSSTGCVSDTTSSCEYHSGFELCSGNSWYKSCSIGVWGSQQNCDTTADNQTCNSGCGWQSQSADTCTSGFSGGCVPPAWTSCTDCGVFTAYASGCYYDLAYCSTDCGAACESGQTQNTNTYYCSSGDSYRQVNGCEWTWGNCYWNDGSAADTKTECGNYICSGNVCKTSCSSNSDCVSGYVCSGGTCVIVNLNIDPDNCGFIGNVCDSDGCGKGTCGFYEDGVCDKYTDCQQHNCASDEVCGVEGNCIDNIPTLAPTNLSASPSCYGVHAVQLNWTDNATNEKNYVIEYSSPYYGPWSERVASVPGGESLSTGSRGFSVGSLSLNTYYHFRIKACNCRKVICSNYSNIASTTTLNKFTQLAGSHNAQTMKNTLSWNYTGTAPISGFEIELTDDLSFYLNNPSIMSYIHTNVEENTYYTYWLNVCTSEDCCAFTAQPIQIQTGLQD